MFQEDGTGDTNSDRLERTGHWTQVQSSTGKELMNYMNRTFKDFGFLD